MSNGNKFRYRTDEVAGHTVHILKINLQAKLQFLTNIPQFPLTVSQFAKQYGATYAINADQFSYQQMGTVFPKGTYAVNGQLFDAGYVEPTIYIGRKNEISLRRPKNIWIAVSGNHVLIQGGKIVPADEGYIFPRTAIGWNNNAMFWVVVDGVESLGTGISLAGLSIIMKSLGCLNAVNMDGGGSSEMVYNDTHDTVSVLNVPSDDNVPGRERPVANCLGVL